MPPPLQTRGLSGCPALLSVPGQHQWAAMPSPGGTFCIPSTSGYAGAPQPTTYRCLAHTGALTADGLTVEAGLKSVEPGAPVTFLG